jgi:hypothetical protein
MRLAQWQQALADLAGFARIHGQNEIPLPQAMAALHAPSRATLFRRLDEMREAGYWVQINGEHLQLLAPDPND